MGEKSITALLGKVRNRIKAIGIELEGGWLKVPDGVRLTQDVSVRVEDPAGRLISRGEIPSPPLEMSKWVDWMKVHYPSHCNESCGLHVHMSFRSDLTYQRLMRRDYTTAIVDQLREWAKGRRLPSSHAIWGRLKGENKYCLPLYAPEKQATARQKSNSRYAVVNYCHGIHQTLEIRVLPMFPTIPAKVQKPVFYAALGESKPPKPAVLAPEVPGIDLAIEAVQRVIDTTNAFLLLDVKRERAERATLISDDLALSIREETRIVL